MMNPYALCPMCDGIIDDGDGPGFVRRHLEGEEHLRWLQKAQQVAKKKYTEWKAIEVDEDGLPVDEELREEEERLELRAALEAALQDEGNDDETTD